MVDRRLLRVHGARGRVEHDLVHVAAETLVLGEQGVGVRGVGAGQAEGVREGRSEALGDDVDPDEEDDPRDQYVPAAANAQASKGLHGDNLLNSRRGGKIESDELKRQPTGETMVRNVEGPSRFDGHEYPQSIPEPEYLMPGGAAPWSLLRASERRGVTLERVERQLRRNERHRSEEHTSELQSRQYLVCRLLLEK